MIIHFFINYYGYYVLFFILFIFSILSILNRKKEKYFFLIFSIVSTFFIIFRFDFEFDYVWYWIVGDNRFKNYWVYSFEYERIAPLFKFLYGITRYFENPKIFFMLTGIIFSYLFFYGIKTYSKKKMLALSLYFYLPSLYFTFLLGFIRQGIAIVMSFFLIKLLLKKKYLKYILGIFFITFFIHRSAMICLLHLVIYKIKNRKKYIIFLKLMIILFFLSIDIILNKINIYTFYLDNKIHSNLGIKMIIIILILYILLEIIINIKKIKLFREEKFYRELISTGILIFILTAIKIGGHVPMRTSIYFFIIFPIYFGNILAIVNSQKNTQILIITFFFIFANFNLIRVSYKEYQKSNLRKSWYFKNSLFNKYEDLSGKYTPHGKIDFKWRN